MANALTIDDVLEITYVQNWGWSPLGSHIAYSLDVGGISDLFVFACDDGSTVKLSDASKGVASFAWHPSGEELAYVEDNGLYLGKKQDSEWQSQQILAPEKKIQSLSWSDDGNSLAFILDKALWIYRRDSGAVDAFQPVGQIVPGRFGGFDALQWSPDSSKLLFHFREEDKTYHLGLMSVDDGALLWRSTSRESVAAAGQWLNCDTFLFSLSHDHATVREFYVAEIPQDADKTLQQIKESAISVSPTFEVDSEMIYRQEAKGTPGSLRVSGAWADPDAQKIVFLSEDDGWAHLYLLCLESREMEQLTFGECEDFGHMGDRPQWSPDGRFICYSSNRGCSGQRQLWLFDVEEKTNYQLTEFEGTNVQPKWNPARKSEIAFIHCDEHRNGDIWTGEIDSESIRTENFTLFNGSEVSPVTDTTPESWTQETVVTPEEVVFEGAKGWDIHGYLIPPVEKNNNELNPAVVWVHGGPIRQMRYGFHPSRSYALFYAFSQYLANRGYATLMVNFRGGIGYGREFRNGIYHNMAVDELEDVVAAGDYLKGLPYIDPERVGIWGLSYGGYMTLAALTKHPEAFTMGINIAGIWDFAQWMHWVHNRRGRQGGLFEVYFGGDPEESPGLYRVGSPCTYKDNINKPLINFHGTADANVDFAQMDRIVKDMVKMGKEYEAYYYPDEEHTFAYRHTWADAFTKIEREMNKYLRR